MVGSGLQTWQRGTQSGGSCGNDQSESPATKGPRRTYDVSRDTLTGSSSHDNVGLPRGELRVLCRRLRPAERAHFPSHAPSMLVSGSDWRNGVRNRHLRWKIPSRTCLHWVNENLARPGLCQLFTRLRTCAT